MTSAAPFHLEALAEQAGEKRRRRASGLAYDDLIDFVDVEEGRIVAHVQGESNVYLVELGDPRGADARCTCADAADNSPVCKHMLAVAMLANEVGGVRPTGRLTRLREQLQLESKEDLIERIVTMAKQAPAVLATFEGED